MAMNSFMRQTPISADQMHRDRQAWENAIAMYQGPDPLDHWYNYVCWYENHGHGDPDNKFRETLERCLTQYEHNEYYKQDPRMTRLWLKYIDMQSNPLHFYQVLYQRGVGRQVAAFYISWAGYYESIHAFKEAESVYNLGFQEKAQALAELHHAYNKFLYARNIAAAAAAAATQQKQAAPAIAAQTAAAAPIAGSSGAAAAAATAQYQQPVHAGVAAVHLAHVQQQVQQQQTVHPAQQPQANGANYRHQHAVNYTAYQQQQQQQQVHQHHNAHAQQQVQLHQQTIHVYHQQQQAPPQSHLGYQPPPPHHLQNHHEHQSIQQLEQPLPAATTHVEQQQQQQPARHHIQQQPHLSHQHQQLQQQQQLQLNRQQLQSAHAHPQNHVHQHHTNHQHQQHHQHHQLQQQQQHQQQQQQDHAQQQHVIATVTTSDGLTRVGPFVVHQPASEPELPVNGGAYAAELQGQQGPPPDEDEEKDEEVQQQEAEEEEELPTQAQQHEVVVQYEATTTAATEEEEEEEVVTEVKNHLVSDEEDTVTGDANELTDGIAANTTSSAVAGICLPKRFAAYCRNNYETWKPALFLEEPSDPCRSCHYAKHLVYPGDGTEYSPEELRARRFGVHAAVVMQQPHVLEEQDVVEETLHEAQYQQHEFYQQQQKQQQQQQQQEQEEHNQQLMQQQQEQIDAEYHQHHHQQQQQHYTLANQLDEANEENDDQQLTVQYATNGGDEETRHTATSNYEQQEDDDEEEEDAEEDDDEDAPVEETADEQEDAYEQDEQYNNDADADADLSADANDVDDVNKYNVHSNHHHHQQQSHHLQAPAQYNNHGHHGHHQQQTQGHQLVRPDDLEDQIEASTIRFSHNKTIKIKFKKDRTHAGNMANGDGHGGGYNYSAYTVESISQQEIASPGKAATAYGGVGDEEYPSVRRNGYIGFHPYNIGQTSTPKTSSKRSKTKLKRASSNKFQAMTGIGSSSNSSSMDAAALASGSVGHGGGVSHMSAAGAIGGHAEGMGGGAAVALGGVANGYEAATFNDNANYSFSSAAALENSNCSLTSAVDRLNFRDNTNTNLSIGMSTTTLNNNINHNNNNNNTTMAATETTALNRTHNAGDFSTFQENSYFATQHDSEAQELRLTKALQTIERHLAKDAIDPFNSELCRAFLTRLDFPGSEENTHDNYKIVQTPLPKLSMARTLALPDAGGVHFSIDKEVGRGSYGSVYKATDVNTGAVVALKFQKPPNTWEIYICDQVLKRVRSPKILPGLMDVSTAIIAPNASLIATEFSPFGSLLDINNKIRQNTSKVMHESLVMHFAAQICDIVRHLHEQRIIHADIKPDNFLLMRIPSSDLSTPSLRLIDFGCAIDMTLFPDAERTKFRKVVQTDGFTCIEMQEGRPWSYETDLFCIAGTVHVMLFGEYMQLQKQRDGSWDIKQKLPRYLKKHVWSRFFGDLLNIQADGDGAELPDLRQLRALFEQEAAKMDSELQKQIRTLSNILYRR